MVARGHLHAATAIDASDLVADSGGTYTLGMSVFIADWVGVVAGWAIAGFFIFLPMYTPDCIVRDRDDHHYLRVGQWLTPVIIFGSFAYVPFMLESGMLLFYLRPGRPLMGAWF